MVGEAEVRIGQLSLARPSAQLTIDLIGHAQPRGADRVAETFEPAVGLARSEEHTSELQSLMRISYAVFCLKKKNNQHILTYSYTRYIKIIVHQHSHALL